jgi:RHS repeat-associated protein
MSGESLMSRHLGSVSELRRSRAYRSFARVAIAGQLLTLLPPMAMTSAAQTSIASLASAAAARAAREADEKLAELRLPPGALLSDVPSDDAPRPDAVPSFVAAPADEEIETLLADYLLPDEPSARASVPTLTATPHDEDLEALLADYLLWGDQRGTTGPGDLARQAAPEPKRVVVNRAVPRVTPRATEPTLSPEPTDREFFDARIFAEPLVPTGATTAEDNRALGQVLRQYVAGGDRENVSLVLAHLQKFPASPWRASLLASIGTVFSQHGYYTRAFESWNAGWQLTKDATDPRVRAVADYAIAQWLELMTRFGDVNALEGKMKELEGRELTGSTGTRIRVAREGLWILKNHHDWATPSARTSLTSWLYVRSRAYARQRARIEMSTEDAALAERSGAAAELDAAGPAAGALAFRMPKALRDFHAREEGTSLRELANLAAASGLRVRPAYRPSGAPLVTPAIAHLKPGHYSLAVKHEKDRVLLRDAILGGEIWMSRGALEEESSGYWLIPEGSLPNQWRAVQDHEATVVIGRCAPGGAGDNDPGCPCRNGGGGPGSPGGSGGSGGSGGGGGCANPGSCPKPSHGMPTYFFHPVSAALRLVDTPVGYQPPRGPAAYFTLSYHQREVLQPATFTYSNLGPMWTFDWLSYIHEVPLLSSPGGNTFNPHTFVFLRGSGAEDYRNPDANGVYPAFFRSRAVLVKVSDSPVRYERRLPDGSIEVFTQSDGAPSGQRRVFLTSFVDPQGQAMQLTYDAQLRVIAFTDAIGQVTTVSYEHPTDALKITKVTDPFGRFATFTYTSAGQLASVTDAIGLTSSFTYASGDFISALTTPYGTTTFRHETNGGYPRMIEATDPLGGTEHLEYHYQNTSLVNVEPAALVPTGFSAFNENLQYYNTFYWSKRQWALHPADITKATRTQWLLYDLNPDDGDHGQASSTPRNIKRPLENTVWYAYPGQSSTRWVGSWAQPSRVGRVLDDGTSQILEKTYNTQGKVTSLIDPLGRRTSYVYAANGIDPLEVRQTTGVLNDLLESFGSYTAQHGPQATTDNAGQSTQYTYNAAGQPLTTTNARNETTTYGYDSNGYLQSITGPISGDTTTYTYDGYGRVYTTTNSDGYTITAEYDALDRVTRVTYPDGTYDQTLYDRLDVAARRDRLGRWTRMSYDAVRRLVATRDPLGRVTTQQWCNCGSLDSVLDGKGQKTSWERDIHERVTREIGADGVTATVQTYEATTNRLKTITDPKLQVTTFSYLVDDALASIVFTNAAIATPSISYSYDPAYRRQTAVTDGTGTTTLTYHPVGVLGAGQLASVDGPLTNDTITYTYDDLERIATRQINGVGVTTTYDALDRVNTETNVLGTFTYTYDGASNRLASVAYPNGQTSSYSYAGVVNDLRLETIHHKRPDTSTLSRSDYIFNPVGSILTWQQQVDSATPTAWQFEHDAVDQLVAAVHSSTGGAPAILNRFAYRYDRAGNRTSEQTGDNVAAMTYNALNRMVQQVPGGELNFKGAINEPASVTIQGQPAVVNAANGFSGTALVSTGATVVTIEATDPSGNTAMANYQVTASGSTKNFTFDANGNLASDGTRSFEWDARNQLVAVNVGTRRSEFTYDGQHRRVRQVEKDNGIVLSDTRLLWCQNTICEERATDGVTVTRRAFRLGEQVGGQARYFTLDHLGSVRDVTDSTVTLLARYAFDPWGRRTLVAGTDVTTVGFTGHRTHENSGLALALYRGYDPELARWVSEDPIGLAAGLNRFRYVRNQPDRNVDPLGLQECRDNNGCCEKSKVYWICERPIDNQPGASYLPNHRYVCCSGPRKKCFGHVTNDLKKGDPIPPDTNPRGSCTAMRVCADLWKKKCVNPKSPCDAETLSWNCRNWAGWDGREDACPQPCGYLCVQ